MLPPIVQLYVNVPDPPVTVEVSVTDCPESMIAEEGDIETDAAFSTVTVQVLLQVWYYLPFQ